MEWPIAIPTLQSPEGSVNSGMACATTYAQPGTGRSVAAIRSVM
jgi:hypothetical protein